MDMYLLPVETSSARLCTTRGFPSASTRSRGPNVRSSIGVTTLLRLTCAKMPSSETSSARAVTIHTSPRSVSRCFLSSSQERFDPIWALALVASRRWRTAASHFLLHLLPRIERRCCRLACFVQTAFDRYRTSLYCRSVGCCAWNLAS